MIRWPYELELEVVLGKVLLVIHGLPLRAEASHQSYIADLQQRQLDRCAAAFQVHKCTVITRNSITTRTPASEKHSSRGGTVSRSSIHARGRREDCE
eukprot:scaffold182693_cov27-Tisochrysis_lutea.AAC.1